MDTKLACQDSLKELPLTQFPNVGSLGFSAAQRGGRVVWMGVLLRVRLQDRVQFAINP